MVIVLTDKQVNILPKRLKCNLRLYYTGLNADASLAEEIFCKVINVRKRSYIYKYINMNIVCICIHKKIYIYIYYTRHTHTHAYIHTSPLPTNKHVR